jgi:hypothetical protein
MTDMEFLDLQNPEDLETIRVRSMCTEICPALSHDAYQDIRILSDAEEEEYPVLLTFVGIETQYEVSCVCFRARRISQIQVSFILRKLDL